MKKSIHKQKETAAGSDLETLKWIATVHVTDSKNKFHFKYSMFLGSSV